MAEENKVKAIDEAEKVEETVADQAKSATETKKVSDDKVQLTKNSRDGKSSKKGKKKNSKKDQSKGLKGVFKGLSTEFSKISWPSRNEITKETCVVLAVSLVLGLCIFGLDKLIIFILVNLMNIS